MTKKEIRQTVFDKYNGHCAYCGCELTLDTMQIDHIKPLWRGYPDEENLKDRRGTDDISNYNPACRACNFRKSTLSVESFRGQLLQLQNRLRTQGDSFNYRMALKYGLITENENKIIFYFEKYDNQPMQNLQDKDV